MSEKSLRTYEENSKQEEFYKEMYKNQTLQHVIDMKEKYEHLGIIKMTMYKALELLNTYVDSSDPDVDEPITALLSISSVFTISSSFSTGFG